MPAKSRKTRVVLIGAAAVMAVGITVAVLRSGGGSTSSLPVPRFEVLARPLPDEVFSGDPELGRRLYDIHCVSCHGARGDGFGPAAAYLWPAPRDHTDGGYMESRSDAQLLEIIRDGGKKASRSVLMPAFGDLFDSVEIWSLVAYVRTLHPRVRDAFPEAERWEHREVILPPADTRRLAEDYKIVYFDVHRGDDLLGRVAFPQVNLDSIPVRLVVAVDPTGKRLMSRTHQRIVPVPGESDDIDSALAAVLSRTVEKLNDAPTALQAEVARADKVRDRFDRNRDAFPPAQRLYIQACGQCHGATGTRLGSRMLERDPRPRNHVDGTYMNLLSDDYLRSIIKYGGYYWNVSGSMPANPGLTEEEFGGLVRHIRSLSVPKADGRCPCSTMVAACMMSAGEASCTCSAGHDIGQLCANMRR